MLRRESAKELFDLYNWLYDRRDSNLSNKTDNFAKVVEQDVDGSDKRNQSADNEQDKSRLCGSIYNKRCGGRETSGARYFRAGNRRDIIRDSSQERSHGVDNERTLGCNSSFERYRSANNGCDISREVGGRSRNTSNRRSKSSNSSVTSNWRAGNSRRKSPDSSGIRCSVADNAEDRSRNLSNERNQNANNGYSGRCQDACKGCIRVRDKSVGRNLYAANGCVRSCDSSGGRSQGVDNERISACDSNFELQQSASNGHVINCEVGGLSCNTSNGRSKSRNSSVISNWRIGNERRKDHDSYGRCRRDADNTGSRGRDYSRGHDQSASDGPYSSDRCNRGPGNERIASRDLSGGRNPSRNRYGECHQDACKERGRDRHLSVRSNLRTDDGRGRSCDSSGGRSRDSSGGRYWWE